MVGDINEKFKLDVQALSPTSYHSEQISLKQGGKAKLNVITKKQDAGLL